MDLNFTDKYAIVCGSTQGIGLAIAHELASLGCNIILIARNEPKLKETVKALSVKGNQKHAYLCVDFVDPENLRKVMETFIENQPRIDILVNNTGGPLSGKAIDAATEDYLAAFKQHLVCNQILVQAVVPLMKTHQYGRIINVISTSVKMPIPGLGVSNTIRGAVASWSKTLSIELGPYGITVNNVLPGATQTGRLESLIRNKALKSGTTEESIQQEMIEEIPAGHFGKPEDLATAVAFLASVSAGYINGINLPVDGGRTGSL